jgi:hypothetical protein
MAAGAWTFYNKAKKNIGNGLIKLSGAGFKMALYTSAAGTNAINAALSTIGSIGNEVAAANGYAAGGQAMTVTWTAGVSAGQLRFSFTNLIWTGTGGTIPNIKFAIAYFSGAASAGKKKLLAYSQLSTSQFTLTQNNTLTVAPSATGMFNLAG